MAAAINKALNEGELTPVGTIRKSMLTEEEYQQEAGDTWVIADGRNVVGSAYTALTGSITIPDVRGVFTRCKAHGSAQFPEQPLGNNLQDTVKTHTHPFTWSTPNALASNGGLDANSSFTKKAVNPVNRHDYTIGNTGGAESRPKSVTLNFFIKIN
jgi:hypothetical protein